MDKVFEALFEINAITPEPINTKELGHDLTHSCKFHMGAVGHSIQNCNGFLHKLQELMDLSVIEFYEEGEEDLVRTINEDTPTEVASSLFGVNKPKPLTIFYEENRSPMNDTSPTVVGSGITIEIPSPFSYKSEKAVPWNYECNILGMAPLTSQVSSTDLTSIGGITRSGQCYSPEILEKVEKEKSNQGADLKEASTFFKDQTTKPPVALNNEVQRLVTEKEVGEFLKFIKHGEYSVVEQLTRMPARISLLSLLLNSKAHRNALLKVLNQAYVAHDISVKKLDHIVGNITMGNFVAFNDEEIPSSGRGSNKALHITIKCKDHAMPRVLIDNGSALNVMPRSTLTKLPVDMSYMRTSHMVVRAFDGTTREVVGDIELQIKVGPCIFEVQFQVMDIALSYNCLLERPWNHIAGAIPSCLHQKVKFIAEGQLISVSTEEDILAIQPTSTPYVEAVEEVPECSFRYFEFINATYVEEREVIPTPRLLVATKMGVKQIVGKGCRVSLGLGKNLQGINCPLTPIKNEERFGLGYKPTKEERKKLVAQKKIKRMVQLQGKEKEFQKRKISHLYETFRSAGYIHPETPTKVNQVLQMFDEQSIHMIKDEEPNEKVPAVYPEEREILPHQELTEMINLGNGEKKKEDMPGLNTDIVVHKLPLSPDCKPIKQKLRRMKPDMLLKIKEEVKKDLNRASLKDSFHLSHIDTLVDNTTKHALFLFMDGFSGYNQIKMAPEDMEKRTFVTMWGTFCYKVMPFGLKNAGATYQRAMVTLFHDMMHKEIEVYVDDMIAKSCTERDHTVNLKKLFERLRKFQLKLNPTKCTFGVTSGKLLGFVVSEKGIEVDSDKIRAIQELPPSKIQKEVRGFLGRLNYIARFISQLICKWDPIFKLLRKRELGEWN
ncbi:PREDICTED: uncharacterized protein LOC108662797 [Theobroma cacao]|uniref:Uncharacterized protein LOC108662797 n=1 Tax=Theobroma cacao TaxID=3641 RepID=A0AB32WKF2_THECC|nr:PREDICTED: uncharacterized protein LOC108662797 [Theobroma cacao]